MARDASRIQASRIQHLTAGFVIIIVLLLLDVWRVIYTGPPEPGERYFTLLGIFIGFGVATAPDLAYPLIDTVAESFFGEDDPEDPYGATFETYDDAIAALEREAASYRDGAPERDIALEAREVLLEQADRVAEA